MKTDYTPDIKNLLQNFYEPVNSVIEATDYTEKKSLSDIHREVTGIVPGKWICETDIYEILVELGFKCFHTTIDEEWDLESGKLIAPARTGLLYFMNKKTAAI